MRFIETHSDRKVDIHGMNNHLIYAMSLVTTGGITTNKTGEIIVIMHQHAHHGTNKTIHYFPQIEHCKNVVDDHSIKVGGRQHITTLDKHKMPISIRGELPYMSLRAYTDKEWRSLFTLYSPQT